MNLLRLENISVRFGGVDAVRDVSIELPQGALLGFIGPNGAGKTTLMRVIIGLIQDYSGEVYLGGKRLDGLATHRRVRLGIGLSQQIVRPFHSMTMRQNIVLAAGYGKTWRPYRSLLSRDRKSEQDIADELLDLLGIGHVADKLPATLPLGYRKRLEMARALALRPTLLLLDEPLAGLNHEEAARLADHIKALNRRGQSIMLIEHNLVEVVRICELLYVQDNGRFLAYGDTQSVLARQEVQHAYFS